MKEGEQEGGDEAIGRKWKLAIRGFEEHSWLLLLLQLVAICRLPKNTEVNRSSYTNEGHIFHDIHIV
ncbi:unnamed protein product [Urochloa humidicola]